MKLRIANKIIAHFDPGNPRYRQLTLARANRRWEASKSGRETRAWWRGMVASVDRNRDYWDWLQVKRQALTLLETSAVLDVPADVAVCPYCGKKLTVQFDQWTEQDDGTWAASSIELDCEGEPGPRAYTEAFDEWLAQHTYMPYVYWLPVDQIVTKWVNERYRFKME